MDTPTEAMGHDDHSQLCWQHRCDWWDPKGWWCKSTSNSSWPSLNCCIFVVKQTCMWKGTHLLERIFYLNHIKMKWNVSNCWAMQSFWTKYHIKRGIANTLPHATCVRFFSSRHVLAKRIWPNMKFAEAPSAETKQSSWSGKRIAIE